MRKVTLDATEAFLQRKNKKTHNTVVSVDKDGNASMILFGNRIAVHTHDGRLFITTAGWNTSTTRSRLSGIGRFRITSRAGGLSLNGQSWDGKWVEIVQADPISMHFENEPPV
jgi:hypothetical protein